jgi:transcriptional regulator with XRE-family HTH domain
MENRDVTTEKSPLPVVAIDGAKIRTVREAQKLTQLYVANVVGVTTDTISRWENNRYPTIRRDNAEKLASALEVDLAVILRDEERGEEGAVAPLSPEKTGRSRRGALVIGAVAILVALLVLFYRQLAAVPLAERDLPSYGAPGKTIPVQIKVDRRNYGSDGFVVKEGLPPGWRFVASLPPAAGRNDANEVKWLIPPGNGPVTISYTVQVAPAAPLKAAAAFTGEVVAHGGGISRRSPIVGDRALTVDGVHWADDNGDGRIDDDEIMPAYYLTEEMKGLGLDWNEIEAIWSGKGYRWVKVTQEFRVVR